MQTAAIQAGEGTSTWVVGDLYSFLVTGEETGGAYALIHATVPPQGGPPPHIHHREDETFYLLEGEITVEVDGRTLAATAGACVKLPRGSLHSFRNNSLTTARMLILVNPSGLENYFAEIGHKSQEESITPAAIQRLVATAPKYGLEIRAPKE
jgi:quercetin dioxygenase-like cupin family protein